MTRRDVFDLVMVAALWGASFLFQRIAAPAFGAVPLAAVRVVVAAAVLLPLLAWRGGFGDLQRRPGAFLLLGAMSTAVPFVLFAWAVLSVSAGVAAILNATAPMFGALVAWVWLRERPGALQMLGLAIGFAGVLWLVTARTGLDTGAARGPVLAGLLACLCYGIAGNYTRRSFTAVPSLTIATGSQVGAAVLLAPLAIWAWPAAAPGAREWIAAIVLGVLSTGLAFVLYFRLLSRVGATRAMTVTLLIPAFAMLWGALFLGERVTLTMIAGCVVILSGTVLASGVVRRPTELRRQNTPSQRH